ncbi:MAG: sigma-54-dependent Fis family transcriptional regulator [Xanthomonadales bacterium]|nr:sigma-54-dependent Fis family transcriptional regulator [Xanthomonadales bacterium]
MPHALLIDKAKESLLSNAEVFRNHGFTVDTADRHSRGRDLLLRKMPDVLFLGATVMSRRMPKLLRILNQEPFAGLIEIYAVVPDDNRRAKKNLDALNVAQQFNDPLDPGALDSKLQAYIEAVERHTERKSVHDSGRGLLVGESPAMRRVYRLIRKAAISNASVLLFGESGTGKELVSRTIHALSERADGPFVAMNSGAVPEDLAESELFGHVKGAFTGADQPRDGVFQRSCGGTLFLDEVTEMPEALQVKLLRVLETGEYQRLGSEQTDHSDFRLISACNREPAAALADGVLREDLFYRIGQFPINLPPLRERGGDVELLAKHFLDREISSHGQTKVFSTEALDLLRLRHWPGNVRELANVVAQAYLMAGEQILPEDLPGELPSASVSEPSTAVNQLAGQSLEEVERAMIVQTLKQCNGNKRKTARTLGISPKTLYARLKDYEIDL